MIRPVSGGITLYGIGRVLPFERQKGSEQFYQKDRGCRHGGSFVRGFSRAGQPMPVCSFPTCKAHAENMERGRKRDQRVRRWNPLPLVSPPSWSLGTPADFF